MGLQIITRIESECKPNITLFGIKCENPVCYPDRDGYSDLNLDMFDVVTHMIQFVRRNDPQTRDTMKTDQKLVKMQCKADLARPKHFPRKYTRMWLSNVPNYTHGLLNAIAYAIPQLEDDPQAAVAFNCMLNLPVWGGDEEYFHTYTLLLPEEIPHRLGCRLISSRAVMVVDVLGTQHMPRPLSQLAIRDELTTWLTRVLFNTFIPGLSKLRPHYVRCPHNLVASFALILYFGGVVSDIAADNDFWPIPVKERLRRVPVRKVRTDPWLVDFENIIATAYHANSFPISSAPTSRGTRPTSRCGSSPYDPRTQLLFYKPSVASAPRLIDDMHRIFEGKAQPPPGTFFVLTMQEYVQYQTRLGFKLSKARVERMKKEQ
ncbi:hypothetical protein BN946_scf184857.g50 [Trametes cinnabarina]|uniref:Uncharacterized protein n=1 Tax=Pycnoporus cinnabarinus TaxID=5643 RepID=A0A060SY28_PYCCI|nr:hypothetical protein BN946_scf184857.g50 [Trametes cinnabarina]